MIPFDYSTSNLTNILENFEQGDLFKLVDEMIDMQGFISLPKEGIENIRELQKGKTHFSIASNRRVNFYPHANVIFAMIRRLKKFKGVLSSDLPMGGIVSLLSDHLFKLFCQYDRGRAKLIKKSGNWLIDELKVLNVSDCKNSDVQASVESLNIQSGYDFDKKQILQDIIPDDCLIPSNIRLHVLSWNVAGFIPSQKEEVEDLFESLSNMDSEELPDVVMVGLQEVVELKARNFTQFFTDDSKNKVNISPGKSDPLRTFGMFLSPRSWTRSEATGY